MSAPAQTAARQAAPVSPWRPALLRSLPVRISVFVICLLWTIPTLGLFVTSVRDPEQISSTGWWTALLNPFAAGQWTLSNYQQVIASGRPKPVWASQMPTNVPYSPAPL